MQPESPYRFTRVLGGSLVGKAWAAVDGQERPVTVILLDGPAATDPRWRAAFAQAVGMLSRAPGGHPYAEADLTSTNPWVAYEGDQPEVPERLFRLLQQDYRAEDATVSLGDSTAPVSGTPVSTGAWSQGPAGDATPGALAETTQQVALYARAPSSQPVSAAPSSGVPVPLDREPFGMPGRRIAPVQVVRKRRGWLPLVAGGLVIALVAGALGYALGGSGDEEKAPSESTALSPFRATQSAINKAKFIGELAPLGEPWLADLSGCVVYNDDGGPDLPANEERHVYCPDGALQLHFVLFREQAQRDAARAHRQELNLAAGSLAPGLNAASRTTGGKTGVPGSYVEYAFKVETGTYCGLWWNRDDSNGVLVIETPCEAGIAGNWEALRDLWRRHS
ncbi:hypothetical protein ACGFIW_28650 [Micromonospora sp. NPDC048935]|uniref:hypothetical protein n=1 Tax=Micromonospora sp. NPDC048935 TaxID=3364262 RepID=UPI003720A586